jgi:phosphonate transport system substrate-binding protein
MKRMLVRLCLLLALVGPLQAEQTLRFAPLPLENRETMIRQFSPLLAYLQAETGLPVRFVFFDSYDDLLAAFAANRIDLAYLGPLPYARLRERHAEAQPLVYFREADGGALYRCVLAAFRGDRVRLAALKGRIIGLTQPLSTCGYLSVNGLLRQHAGFDLKDTRYRYLGTHENVALATLGGEVAAGGMKESIARKYAGLGLEVLAKTEPLPGFALVANRATIPPARVAQLRQRLLATPENAYRAWGEPIRHGMAPASDGDYTGLRALDVTAIPTREKDQ